MWKYFIWKITLTSMYPGEFIGTQWLTLGFTEWEIMSTLKNFVQLSESRIILVMLIS